MFLNSIKAAGADRSVFGDFWFTPIGSQSSSGMRVTADAALRLTAVWACVRILSETLASMPFCMYRNKPNGGKEFITDHPVATLFNRAPNSYQTPFEWRELLQAHLALRGNAYCEIITDRKGVILELQPIHPDRVKIEMIAGGSWRYQVLQADGTRKPYGRGEIWHLRGMSFDGISGLSPIEQARDAVGMGLSAQEYGARFFQNDARPGGVIEFNGAFKDQTARKTFMDSWRSGQAGANRGKTAVLEHDMKYKEIGLNNSDAQFIEARKFQVTEIARMFRVPPHMIADLDRATFSNIEHQSLEFVLHTMTPWAERWESSIETNLLTESEADLEIEFDFTSLLRGDHNARAAYYGSGITNGWMTRNEARLMEGYDPIAGLDMPLQQLNMAPAGSNPMNKAPKQEDANGPIPPDARHLALVNAVAHRVARKEMEIMKAAFRSADRDSVIDAAYKNHANFVAACMNVPIESARAYCDARKLEAMSKTTEDDFMAVAIARLEHLALKGPL